MTRNLLVLMASFALVGCNSAPVTISTPGCVGDKCDGPADGTCRAEERVADELTTRQLQLYQGGLLRQWIVQHFESGFLWMSEERTFEYRADGKLDREVSAKSVIQYLYDDGGRLAAVEERDKQGKLDSSLSYEYVGDAADWSQRADDLDGDSKVDGRTTRFIEEGLLRGTEYDQSGGGIDWRTEYVYDQRVLTQRTYSEANDGFINHYAYDDAGRVKSIDITPRGSTESMDSYKYAYGSDNVELTITSGADSAALVKHFTKRFDPTTGALTELIYREQAVARRYDVCFAENPRTLRELSNEIFQGDL